MKRSPWNVTYRWMDVVYDPDGMEQASMINRNTGECYLNKRKLGSCSPETLEFIKKHEEGHYVHQTDYEDDLINELIADTHAFYETMKKYNSLINIVDAHSMMLERSQEEGNGNPAHHDARVANIDRLCRQYDYYVNGNPNAKSKSIS